MPDITPIDANTPIVTVSGVMSDVFQRWMSQVTRNDLLIGTGSPEGVIEAIVGRQYLDTTGASGATQYIKKLPHIGGDKTQGWSL